MRKQIKVSEELYDRVKTVAQRNGVTMTRALDALVESTTRSRELSPDSLPSEVAILDDFFGSIGNLVTEVKVLRDEKKVWMERANSWAGKVADLQQLLANPD